jgi:hypothetical protein
MFLKKVVEVGDFSKTQHISDIRDAQVTATQEDLCFAKDTFRNNLRGSPVHRLFYCPVQMVDMNVQLVRILRCISQADRMRLIKWKLPSSVTLIRLSSL